MDQEPQDGKIDRSLSLWLVAALISFLFSVILWFLVDKQAAIFVGLWVPSILSLSATLRTQR
jgi:hypothetical protein